MVDKDSKFYNRSMKSWLLDNALEMYSTHNEGKLVFAERFIRTLKNKIGKYMTSLSKNVYMVKLVDTINKYVNAYHRTIKMKSADINSSTYIDCGGEKNEKDPKFEFGDQVRIPYKYFCKTLHSKLV